MRPPTVRAHYLQTRLMTTESSARRVFVGKGEADKETKDLRWEKPAEEVGYGSSKRQGTLEEKGGGGGGWGTRNWLIGGAEGDRINDDTRPREKGDIKRRIVKKITNEGGKQEIGVSGIGEDPDR